MSKSKYAKRLRALGFHWWPPEGMGFVSIDGVPPPPPPPPVPQENGTFFYIVNFFGSKATGAHDELGEFWICFSKHVDLHTRLGFDKLSDRDIGEPHRLTLTITIGDAE